MYIPRPTKLLFQHNDGWSQYLDKHGDTLSDWTKLAVIYLLRDNYAHINPGGLLDFDHIRNEDRWRHYLHAQYRRVWKGGQFGYRKLLYYKGGRGHFCNNTR